jgi:hypothetical protein
MVWVYTYTDCAGNTHDWSYTYTIDDNIAPTITYCPPDYVPTTCCSDNPNITGRATATDNCGGEVTIRYTDVVSATGVCPKVITRTWIATDCAGNTSSCTQKIYCPCGNETAVAAQQTHEPKEPGIYTFNGSSWFTFITFDKPTEGTKEQTYPIYAGQDYLAGTLTVKWDGTKLWVKYSIEGQGDLGGKEWIGIKEYHLQVECTAKDLEDAITTKKKNFVPGQCETKGSYEPWGATDTGWIEANITGNNCETFYIFAHSVMWWSLPTCELPPAD